MNTAIIPPEPGRRPECRKGLYASTRLPLDDQSGTVSEPLLRDSVGALQLSLGLRDADTACVDLGNRAIPPAEMAAGRRRRRFLLVAVAAAVVGVGIAVRLIDSWGAGGPHADQRIPTAFLIYFGAFFIVSSALILIPSYWKRYAERSPWSGRTVFGSVPPREALPVWRRALWDIQNWLIGGDSQRREAMRRDPRPYQLRYAAITVSAGITLVLYAALR
jgi:hypothetical protein